MVTENITFFEVKKRLKKHNVFSNNYDLQNDFNNFPLYLKEILWLTLHLVMTLLLASALLAQLSLIIDESYKDNSTYASMVTSSSPKLINSGDRAKYKNFKRQNYKDAFNNNKSDDHNSKQSLLFKFYWPNYIKKGEGRRI